MRSLVRNNSAFYYAKYDSKAEIIDDYGNKTGQYELVYDKPIRVNGNISASKGEVQSQQFGDSENYDKVIVLDNKDIPIDEYSILWVDTLPIIKEDGSTDTPHDYIVRRVAKSLNSISLAISKVIINA